MPNFRNDLPTKFETKIKPMPDSAYGVMVRLDYLASNRFHKLIESKLASLTDFEFAAGDDFVVNFSLTYKGSNSARVVLSVNGENIIEVDKKGQCRYCSTSSKTKVSNKHKMLILEAFSIFTFYKD